MSPKKQIDWLAFMISLTNSDLGSSMAGYVLSFAGDASPGQINDIGTAAEFQNPYGISVSSTGVIYVADSTRIRAINETTGTSSTSTFTT